MYITGSLAMKKKKSSFFTIKKGGGGDQMLFPQQMGKDFLNVLQSFMSAKVWGNRGVHKVQAGV